VEQNVRAVSKFSVSGALSVNGSKDAESDKKKLATVRNDVHGVVVWGWPVWVTWAVVREGEDANSPAGGGKSPRGIWGEDE
jgi:hypothetical protein